MRNMDKYWFINDDDDDDDDGDGDGDDDDLLVP